MNPAPVCVPRADTPRNPPVEGSSSGARAEAQAPRIRLVDRGRLGQTAPRRPLAARAGLLGARRELRVVRVADLDEGEAVRRHHLELAGARRSHPADARRPLGGELRPRRPRRTRRRARAPCCGRTRRPARRDEHAVGRRGSRRTPAACGSSWRPRAACSTPRSRAARAGLRPRHPSRRRRASAGYQSVWLRRSGSRGASGVGDAVLVAAPERGEAGVEAGRRRARRAVTHDVGCRARRCR